MKKTVVVTGATSGFGLATAKKFKENGDLVIAVSRNAKKTEDVVRTYGFAAGFSMDVSDYSRWQELKAFVTEKFGRIDVLVNNAGGGIAIADVTDQKEKDIDAAISVNLNSVIYGCSVFGKMMKEQKDGVIVNISSVCAKHAWQGWSVYAAAKAGVLNFTKGLYVELRPFGVRATCVIPASSSTGFQKNANIGETHDSLTAEDVANAVFFAACQPKGVVVEEMTVWGVAQECCPL